MVWQRKSINKSKMNEINMNLYLYNEHMVLLPQTLKSRHITCFTCQLFPTILTFIFKKAIEKEKENKKIDKDEGLTPSCTLSWMKKTSLHKCFAG